ncbi:MAG: FtsX-like permease family protein [Bacteroidia bacterium]|jgi:putative ABC transport system permease protein|nr:ABC transporter permease [Bacteroidales bacterium]MDD3301139.1 ABC transporter permease [Bacteroidales bacterium]MDD3843462.1 ABC transporter permease [Bacteroidales bacterium]MDD4617797.1 ABC transporter permease [Bacteroidales bacterium]NCC45550.1 FtsX-like permease family protein [Bacteroidia bacterium]
MASFINGNFSLPGINPLLKENFRVSIRSIQSSKLRSVLTILIIAIGITSLVGILTATDSLKAVMNDSFGKMGANSFSIRSNFSEMQSAERKARVINRRNISYNQAVSFVKNYDVPSVITISATAAGNVVIKAGSEKTNPTINVIATDQNNLDFIGAKIAKGRNFHARDMESSSFMAIIGSGVANVLFRNGEAVGKVITVGAVRYEVIGVLEAQGATFGGGADSQVWIPLTNARSIFLNENSFFTIGVTPLSVSQEFAMEEAEQVFRSVRRLTPVDKSDFRVTKSDAMMEDVMKIMSYVTIAAFIIGSITLLGAAVGLMNIMLVSVKERTREIGTRKALGANSVTIKQQFLFESIVIGQLGGISGIVLGVVIGNLTALVMKTPFIIPWLWIFSGIMVCLLVSVLSGYVPAVRASKLDPIEALRYE